MSKSVCTKIVKFLPQLVFTTLDLLLSLKIILRLNLPFKQCISHLHTISLHSSPHMDVLNANTHPSHWKPPILS